MALTNKTTTDARIGAQRYRIAIALEMGKMKIRCKEVITAKI
jgi:hypothetical protein